MKDYLKIVGGTMLFVIMAITFMIGMLSVLKWAIDNLNNWQLLGGIVLVGSFSGANAIYFIIKSTK